MSESSPDEDESSSTLEVPPVEQKFQPLMLDKYLEVCPDVDVQGDYSHTGVWHSAKGFLDYLLQRGDVRGNIMELGAGTGWLGISLAHSLATAADQKEEDSGTAVSKSSSSSSNNIVLTDRQGTWLQTNLEAAQSQEIPGCNFVSCVGMDWKRKPSVRKVANMMPWDWIIGSDLVYTEEGVEYLAGALQILATAGKARILYAHTLGRMAELDQLWEQELQKVGLTWKIAAKLPVLTHQGSVWEGRTTLIMDIYPADIHENTENTDHL